MRRATRTWVTTGAGALMMNVRKTREQMIAEVVRIVALRDERATRLSGELGDKAGAAQMHNTRGLGLGNCLAAFEAGVRTFEGWAWRRASTSKHCSPHVW